MTSPQIVHYKINVTNSLNVTVEKQKKMFVPPSFLHLLMGAATKPLQQGKQALWMRKFLAIKNRLLCSPHCLHICWNESAAHRSCHLCQVNTAANFARNQLISGRFCSSLCSRSIYDTDAIYGSILNVCTTKCSQYRHCRHDGKDGPLYHCYNRSSQFFPLIVINCNLLSFN